MKMRVIDPEQKPEPIPWRKVAKFAKKHPGQWVAPERAIPAGYITQVNGASLVAFRPRGQWEARSLFGLIVIRYVGEADRG